jgi:hypothetical protein
MQNCTLRFDQLPLLEASNISVQHPGGVANDGRHPLPI